MASQGWLDCQLYLRERDDWLQVRCRALPRQHAVAQALWHPRGSWKFLAEQRLLSSAPARDQRYFTYGWKRGAGGARAWEDLSQEQTSSIVRRGRRNFSFNSS